MKFLLVEFKKQKGQHSFFLFLLVFAFTVLWLLWCLDDLDFSRFNDVTGLLMTNLLLMNTILLPLVLAVFASRLADVERLGNTYKWLCTMESSACIYRCKAVVGTVYLSVFALAQAALFALTGNFFVPGFSIRYVQYFVTLLAVYEAVFLFQLNLSFASSSQLLPLFVSVGATFTGIFSWFLNQYPLRYLIPWGYFAALCNVGMYYQEDIRYSTYTWSPYPVLWLVILLIFIGIEYLWGSRFFRKHVLDF